jgi:metal-responsive CopG/Arc/MetJ family transcriptional regulator
MTTTVKKIELDSELSNKISEIAKDKNTSENEVITDLIKKGLEPRKKSKIPDYLIANKNRKPNLEEHEKLAGFIKNVKPFNAVELIREAREGR